MDVRAMARLGQGGAPPVPMVQGALCAATLQAVRVVGVRAPVKPLLRAVRPARGGPKRSASQWLQHPALGLQTRLQQTTHRRSPVPGGALVAWPGVVGVTSTRPDRGGQPGASQSCRASHFTTDGAV
eukprot:9349616-Pyramimonas_sp.AAC.1